MTSSDDRHHRDNVLSIVRNLVASSHDASARVAYERAYEAYKTAEPVVTAFGLLGALAGSSEALAASRETAAVGQLAGVLLRRLLENQELNVWERMDPHQQAHFASETLRSFVRLAAAAGASSSPSTRPVEGAFVHLISELARLKRGEDWPELFRAIYELSASEGNAGSGLVVEASRPSSLARAGRVVLACELFEKISDYCSLEKYVAFVGAFLNAGMRTATASAPERGDAVSCARLAGEVRLASFRAAAALLSTLDPTMQSPEERRSLADTLRLMVEVLRSTALGLAATGGGEERRGSRLEESFARCLLALVRVTEARASLLKPHLESILTLLIGVAGEGGRFDSATRRAALEAIVGMCTKFAGTTKKRHPPLAKAALLVCLTAVYEGMRHPAGEFPERASEIAETEASRALRDERFLKRWLDKLEEEGGNEEDLEGGGGEGPRRRPRGRGGEREGGGAQEGGDAAPSEADAEDDDFDQFQDSALVGAGVSGLSRLASLLGGKFAMRTLAAHLPALARDEHDWCRRRTAFYALSCLVASVSKQVYREVVTVLALVLPHAAGDPHPMVRYSAVHVLGNMAACFADPEEECEGEASFSKIASEGALPVLARELTCTPHWRLRSHAAEALINYFSPLARDFPPEEVPQETLEVLVSGVVLHLAEAPTEEMKERACHLAAQLALKFESQQERFAPFYAALMPGMLPVVSRHVLGLRRGKGLETLGIMASALPLLFKGNAGGWGAAAMDLVLAALRQGEDEDLRRYGLTTVARLAKALGSDFTRFLPELFPVLVSRAREEVRLAFVSEEEALGAAGAVSEEEVDRRRAAFLERLRAEGFALVSPPPPPGETSPDKRHLVVKSSAIRDVAVSIFALYTVAEDLGCHFAPYVEEALAVVLPLVRFSHMDAVRNCALVALPKLLACLLPAHPGRAADLLMQILPVLAERISTLADGAELSAEEGDLVEGEGLEEEDMETALHAGEALEAVLKMAYESGGARDNDPRLGRRANADAPPLFGVPPSAQDGLLACLAGLLSNRVEIIVEGRAQAEAIVEGEDEENAGAVREEFARVDELETELMQCLVNALGYFLKGHARALRAPFAARLLPMLRSWLEEGGPVGGSSNEDIEYEAVCVLDDAAEFGVLDEEAQAFLLERCLAVTESRSRTVTLEALRGRSFPSAGNRMRLAHASAWGLGVLAHRGTLAWSRETAGRVAHALIDFVGRFRTLAERCESRAEELRAGGGLGRAGGGGKAEGEEEEVEEEDEAEATAALLERAAFQARLGADNAVSAIDKVARHRLEGEDSRRLREVLVRLLPLTTDADEAKVVNAQLEHLVSVGALSPVRRLELLAAQLEKGYDPATERWDEAESFLDEELRAELQRAQVRGG